MDVSRFHFQAPSSPNHLTYGVCWRSRAGALLPVRRWKRRQVDALARRMLLEREVAVMGSDNPDFGGKGRLRDGGTAQAREKNQLWNGTSQSVSPRSRRPARSRMSSRRRQLASTEEDIFRTPTGRRRWRHFCSFGIVEGNDPPNPVSNVGTRRWTASARCRHR